jgi:hypothetical protein
MRVQQLGLIALLVLSGCWNFDDVYSMYCDGGHCVLVPVDAGQGTTDGGVAASGDGGSLGSRDAGLTVVDAGIDAGLTVVDAGSNASDAGGAAVDAGVAPVDAGASPADAGTKADAGVTCLGWGSSCAGQDCCATSDAGIRMACSRNNLCQEYAPDCRETGFDCTGNSQCCNSRCEAGRCAVCQNQAGPCSAATDCCPGYSCGADKKCTYAATLLADGARCNSSGFCQNKFCDLADAGPHDGICTQPTTCSPLGSALSGVCCPGLETVGSNCCLPTDAWCEYGSDCCTGNCLGRRCSAASSAGIGERCLGASQCLGLLTICDPVGFTCSERLCLPIGKNLFSGCCTLISADVCRFDNGSSCLVGGAGSTDRTACCSGQISAGNCTAEQYY